MAVNNNSQQPKSLLHSLLSFIVPGLGQIIARQWARGIAILITFFALGGLSVWTVSQRARFPDFALAQKLYIPIFFQALALLIFFVALRYLTVRFVIKDVSIMAATNVGLGILYVLALVFVQDQIIEAVGSEDELRTIFSGTALFSAAALAALHLWQAGDAGVVGASVDGKLPSSMGGILFACLAIFTLGWNITKIDMEKAIAEYKDTQVILRRIVWPWRSAFEYEESAVEEEAKIQAPCPAGEVGPDVNQPVDGESWISVTPTCGEISVRDLAAGKLALGTELTITGGGFSPGAVVEILWRNPIGNPFRPRGVGETEITMDA
ncbi:MAG: hypothetical protein GY805_01185, partial [Chloroflexi bacterium]|nr:hypothetical protein [Chloroflexota bacterium]